jgi:hypothetical protein
MAKAVKTRNDSIKAARITYRDVVAAAKAERDNTINAAEMDYLVLTNPGVFAVFQAKAAAAAAAAADAGDGGDGEGEDGK